MAKDSSNSPDARTGLIVGFLGIVAFVVIVVVILPIFVTDSGDPNQGKNGAGPTSRTINKYSDEELVRLYSIRNVAMGHLEIDKISDAIEAFTQLATQVPDEPLAVRNLTIAHFKAYEKDPKDSRAALAAIEQLKKVEPKSGIPYCLESRILNRLSQSDPDSNKRDQYFVQAVKALEKAMELEPKNAIYVVELFELAKDNPADEYQTRSATLLKQATSLAPNNLYVMNQLMKLNAARKSPELAESIDAILVVLRPYGPSIQKRINFDVVKSLSDASDAIKAGDMQSALTKLRPVGNALTAEEFVKSDARRISNVNSLEFAAYEFSDAFSKVNPKPPTPIRPGIDVKFAARADTIPELPAVRDVAFGDFDMDGKLDLFVLTEKSLVVLQAESDGKTWKTATSLDVPDGFQHLLVADLDRDEFAGKKPSPTEKLESKQMPPSICFEADLDVVLYGSSGVKVIRNHLENDVRKFVDVEQPAEIQAVSDVTVATFVDYDHDGDLDLVMAGAAGVSLWHNLENLTFSNGNAASVLPPDKIRFTSIQVADLDRDLDLDIILNSASDGVAGFLENLRHGEMRWVEAGQLAEGLGDQIEVAVVDPDRNATWDLVAVGKSGAALFNSRMRGGSSIQFDGKKELDTSAHTHVAAFDFDNDGWQDVVVFGGDGMTLLRATGESTFAEASVLPPQATAQQLDVADIDGDGDLDIGIVAGGKLQILDNDGGNKNHWLTLRIRGMPEEKSGKVNHNGIGSMIEVKAGTDYQAVVVNRSVTHVGLGENPAADVVRVIWTNGVPQSVTKPKPDQPICEKLTLIGSCPFLYTWNGESFAFHTDCLWAAPIGLQFAPGVQAPSRAWEYLKIEGEMLRPRDGNYVLSMTEELWEATYVDVVELVAVDHPVGTEIYTNEKVGPAEIAQPQILTARNKRYPISVTNHRGRDLIDQVKVRDGRFAQAFDRTIRQGVTEPTYVEIDLGKLDNPKQIHLFLTGWIKPTNTSLNIAISENPAVDGPKPPSILVPDELGKWIESVAYMGFPGGKTKTMVVDLSKVFLTNDYRIRIATTQQIYWDEIFFTVDDEPVATRVQPLPLVAADLHHRGFSAPIPNRESEPETFRYGEKTTAPKWAPMYGKFTRFGDVTDLLHGEDARMVVLGAGDEMLMSFKALPPPPEGWVRDFVMHNVGWDKDADMNTVYGQAVEPLPFVTMQGYPSREVGPETMEYKDYLRTYQTRTYSPLEFWQWVRGGDRERFSANR